MKHRLILAAAAMSLADEALKFTRLSLRELPTRYQHDSTRADAFRDKCIEYLKKLGNLPD